MADDVEEIWSIGALAPPVPPDETQGIIGGRDLSEDEVAQARADAALIQAVALLMPYARVVDALVSLDEVVGEIAERPTDRMSNNARRRASGALRAMSGALTQMPDALAEAIGGKLGEDFDPASVLDEVGEAPPEYVLSCAFDAVPRDQLEVIRLRLGAELMAQAPAARGLSDATGVELPEGPIPLLTLAERAAAHAARIVAHWLVAASDPLREASLRVKALGAEVVEGHPAIIKIVLRQDSDGGEPDILNMTPSPLPIDDIVAAQAAVRRAEDLLSDEERPPALSGGPGMLAEEILSQADGWAVDTPEPEDDEDLAEEEGGPEDDDPGARPADLDALLRHVADGATRLEQAWSRALDDEPEQLEGEWQSFLGALHAEVAAREAELDAEDAPMEWPPTTEELGALDLAPEEASTSAGQLRLAQITALASFTEGVGALAAPSRHRFTVKTGRLERWWSSGAFAQVGERAQLVGGLFALPEEGGPMPPQARIRKHLHRAIAAWDRGDPEGALLHGLGAVDACSELGLSKDGKKALSEATRFLDLARDALRRLAGGDPVDPGAVVLLARGTLELAAGLCADA